MIIAASVAWPAASGASARAHAQDDPVVEVEATYTADGFANLRGGLRRDAWVLDNLDLTVTLHLDALTGWRGASLFVYGLGNQGGDPTDGVGDVQGVNNIEAVDAWRIYEAWIQQRVLGDHLSVLAGLYDLNSEFDVLPSASVFVNSSFGIGAEFALSRPTGPSIFPVTSPGVRLRALPLPHLYVQAAVLDGIPGDPGDPARTHIAFGPNDGALLVGEAGWLAGAARPGDERRELRRRRIGRLGQSGHRAKLAVGVWGYTARFDRLDVPPGAGQQRGNMGAYLLGEWQITREGDPAQGLWIFARAGLADPSVNRIAGYTGAGLMYAGPLAGREADQVGFGIAAAHNGTPFREMQREAGVERDRSEVVIEGTYAAVLSRHIGLQFDLQLVVNPDTDPARATAVLTGLRMQIGF